MADMLGKGDAMSVFSYNEITNELIPHRRPIRCIRAGI